MLILNMSEIGYIMIIAALPNRNQMLAWDQKSVFIINVKCVCVDDKF